ncbi:hypothetical protein KM043_008531 [Ampulex compressa]|nr:hypothetical protein KM043_008531 [Ampulex compressa]
MGAEYGGSKVLSSSGRKCKSWDKRHNLKDEKGEARILLSLLPIPSTGKKIAQEWKAGVEFVISNRGTWQRFPGNDVERDIENTPGILLGTQWTKIWITWGGGFISMGMDGSSKPLIMEEYRKKYGITSLYPEGFLYYGITGTNVLWSTGFCEHSCEIHTTFGVEFFRLWPMQKSNDTYDVHFYVRANRQIEIQLCQSPTLQYPSFTIKIEVAGVTSLTYQENEKSTIQYLKDVPTSNILDFWTWKEFTISIFGPHLQLYLRQIYGNEEILYLKNNMFSSLRWFSIGSKGTIAIWSLFCAPDAENAVEDPWPPNCISDLTDYNYQGTQWTSTQETPCIPWMSAEVPDDDKLDERFIDGSALRALNKCRNPTHDPNGPYCYTISHNEQSTASKRFCPIRSCRSSECRMAGTANDYVGTLSETRSGRTCAQWFSDYDFHVLMSPNVTTTSKPSTYRTKLVTPRKPPLTQQELLLLMTPKVEPPPAAVLPPNIEKPVHPVDRKLLNDSLYPERDARKAKNYCRDPSRNIAGAWCYTTDPAVPKDLCNVRDCEKPEECTFLVKGQGTGRRSYVLPEHRSEGLRFSVKAWEPDKPDSITFVFTADDGLKSQYVLKIGALDNEKVLLYYKSEEQGLTMVKKKTLPHLLFLGKWSSFLIRVPRGRVSLHYEGAPNPLFEWEHPEPAKAFLPVYYSYGSEKGDSMGVAFECTSRCHIENTETDRYTKILPLSAWNKRETPQPDKLLLNLRGKGVILIPLLLLPGSSEFYALTFGEIKQWIFFVKHDPNVEVLHRQRAPGPLFTTHSWTNITIRWLENTIDVFCNDTNVFHYQHRRPLLFYFFSLGVHPGSWATWAVNCIPPDIDGPPADGGWSEWGPWACSASCDGGTGTRKRRCNSPEPNIRGEPCVGPDTMTGRCNTIICGDITEDTVMSIRRRIRRNYTALAVREGNSVLIPSYSDIVDAVRRESPDSKIQWSHNGVFVWPKRGRIEIENFDIKIVKSQFNDSGVYVITVHRVDGTYTIFGIVTLVVLPTKESIAIRETLSLSLMCHCSILGYVYSDLKVSWELNNDVWKDYGITLPMAVDVDYIPSINKSHNGLWKCVIKQDDLNFKWITNALFVKVLGPPNWRTHLMEDKLTRPIFGWMPDEDFVGVAAFVGFFIVSIAIIVASVFFIRSIS